MELYQYIKTVAIESYRSGSITPYSIDFDIGLTVNEKVINGNTVETIEVDDKSLNRIKFRFDIQYKP